MYSGSFYQRFVEGKWTASEGLVYPFMENDSAFCDVPQGEFEDWAVSCDYGTVNPASFGLWGLLDGVWYRVKEYYFDSRKEGYMRTDEEHYEMLCKLTEGIKVRRITIDPSAASFIETVRRHGCFDVIPARNNVTDGIRKTATALKQGKIKICDTCSDALREFGLYRWDGSGKDIPLKENDHAMDDIRYFVSTLLDRDDDFFVVAARR